MSVEPTIQELLDRLNAVEQDNNELRARLSRPRTKEPGTPRTKSTMIYTYNGKGPVLNTAAIFDLLGVTEYDIVSTSWKHGCVESALKQSLLRGGKSPKNAITQEQWLSKHRRQGELSV
jgi:hypothetical protein